MTNDERCPPYMADALSTADLRIKRIKYQFMFFQIRLILKSVVLPILVIL